MHSLAYIPRPGEQNTAGVVTVHTGGVSQCDMCCVLCCRDASLQIQTHSCSLLIQYLIYSILGILHWIWIQLLFLKTKMFINNKFSHPKIILTTLILISREILTGIIFLHFLLYFEVTL